MRGYAHARGAFGYCTLVGGASDVDSEDASLPSAEPESDSGTYDGAAPRKRPRESIRTRQEHCGDRPYPCNEPGCEYRAAQASSVKTHFRTHSGERPYACDAPGCEYRTATAINLARHKRTHTGERPFACDEPGASTGQFRQAPSRSTSACTAASGHTPAMSRAVGTGPARRKVSRFTSAPTVESSRTRATNPGACTGPIRVPTPGSTRRANTPHIDV
ncbi:hypothetical protein T492DRAFT_960253 [Pavlovales sp. CCMP2436]|nr:hypothetical protein T492DRAFT_960253 [Pavlovales sp. CCMP2436]